MNGLFVSALCFASLFLPNVSSAKVKLKHHEKEKGSEEKVVDSATVMGGIDKSVIDEYVRRHIPQVHSCYQREIAQDKSLQAGRMKVHFTIGKDGQVSEAGFSESTLKNEKVSNCVVSVVKNITFPEPLGGGVVDVQYPFTFSSATK